MVKDGQLSPPRYHFVLLLSSEMKGIPDESDQFMMDPAGFASKFAKNWSLSITLHYLTRKKNY